MKRILITGAGSYIGTSVQKHLNKFVGEYDIDTVDMTQDSWKSHSFCGYDCVFHVAAIVHKKDKCDEQTRLLYNFVNNELAVETAKKAKADCVKQFIFVSTTAVYGQSAPIGKQKIISQESEIMPDNNYAVSKYEAEKGITALSDNSFKVVIVRPPIIYGKNCKGNYRLLSKIAVKSPIFPKVDNIKSMLYIDNFCEFIRLMIKNEEQGVFMPQNSDYVNTTDLVVKIASAHNKKIKTTRLFNPLLSFVGLFTNKVSKAFGSIAYSHELSDYKEDYNIVDFEESVRLSEGASND